MIDPLESVLAWCKTQPGIIAQVETRIAARHRYRLAGGGGWPDQARALTIRAVGGAPADVDGGSLPLRLEARAYGASSVEALTVAAALISALQARNGRSVTATSGGKSLLYWLIPESSPTLDVDLDTGFDVAIVPLSASVALADVI